MNKQEFEALTGVEISDNHYAVVEKYYMLTSITKQVFVSRHFSACFSEYDIYRCLKSFAVEYYPMSTALLREVFELGSCRRSGRFDIG